MAIQSRKAIRNRIVDLLETITTITGTSLTVMSRIRNQGQAYEGFLLRVRLRSSVNRQQDSDIRIIGETWLIELYSPRTGLGNEALKEDQMYDYADSIVALFIEYDQLNDPTTKRGLKGVSSGEIVSEAIVWQSDTSLNEDGQSRSKWTFNLDVIREEQC